MKRILIVVVALLLAGGGAFLLTSRTPTAAPEASAPQPASTPAAVGSAMARASAGADIGTAERAERPATASAASAAEATPATITAAAPGAVYELPAEDLPLRDSAAALIEAHRAGHLPATKRLMKELTDCQRHRTASLRMDMMIAFEDSPRGQRHGGERMQEAMASAAELVAELAERCERLPDGLDEALLFEVQRRAADAGDLAGQLGFVLVPALSLNKALQQLDRLAIYKEQAPQYLQRALEQGSGQAVAGFMEGYEHYFEGWRGRVSQGTAMQTQALRKMIDAARPQTPLQQVLGEDLLKAYTYATLCKRTCNGTDQARAEAALGRLRVALEPDQRRQAEDDAAALYDAHFHARAQPEDIDLERMRDSIMGFRR